MFDFSQYSQFLTNLIEEIKESKNPFRAQKIQAEAFGVLKFLISISPPGNWEQIREFYRQFMELSNKEINIINEEIDKNEEG